MLTRVLLLRAKPQAARAPGPPPGRASVFSRLQLPPGEDAALLSPPQYQEAADPESERAVRVVRIVSGHDVRTVDEPEVQRSSTRRTVAPAGLNLIMSAVEGKNKGGGLRAAAGSGPAVGGLGTSAKASANSDGETLRVVLSQGGKRQVVQAGGASQWFYYLDPHGKARHERSVRC